MGQAKLLLERPREYMTAPAMNSSAMATPARGPNTELADVPSPPGVVCSAKEASSVADLCDKQFTHIKTRENLTDLCLEEV